MKKHYLKARYLKTGVAGALIGALAVGSALAGVSLTPLGTQTGTDDPTLPTSDEVLAAAGLDDPVAVANVTPGTVELAPADIPAVAAADVTAPSGGRLPAGTFLVGAARASLHPEPTAFGGTTWQTSGCPISDQVTAGDTTHLLPDPGDFVDDARSWPGTPPDCIYLGGFGIGPERAAERVGHGGVWVRTIAISNGEKTFIYGIADTVGWFAKYDPTICPTSPEETGCGIRDVRDRLATDLGIEAGDVIIGSTHTHAGADTYGGWGGIPDWYRNQLRDAAIASAKQAIANMQPATITTGEAHLRNRNNERRDTYYSNVDTGATWLQATGLPVEICEGTGKGKGKGNETCRTETPVITTLATYAGHPTIVGESILHADWPGAAARRFESLYGGVGLMFEGGLGNASVSGAGGASDEEQAENTGIAIGDDLAAAIAAGSGTTLASNDMTAAAQDITHPALVSNPGLVTLGSVGLFDRAFLPGTNGAGTPSVYYWSKNGELSTAGEDNDAEAAGETVRGCASEGPAIVTTAGAHRIGELVIAFAPGEIFSNIAEVVKEKADRSAVTMVLGQTNDALGYIIQSFEFDETGNIATEYGTQTGEYEEVFAIDRCFGDHVLETLLESTGALNAGR